MIYVCQRQGTICGEIEALTTTTTTTTTTTILTPTPTPFYIFPTDFIPTPSFVFTTTTTDYTTTTVMATVTTVTPSPPPTKPPPLQADNWSELLTMAEFCYNNTLSTSIGITPFYAMYGESPRYQILPWPDTKLPTPAMLKEFADSLASLNGYFRSEMSWAQAISAENANEKRLPAPKLTVGDEVWLLRKNLTTTRPSAKLDFKRLGKFHIMKKVSSHAYKLDLPASMKIHPVFHVSLLEPAATDLLPGQIQPPPPPVIIEDDDELQYEVDEVVDSRFIGKTFDPSATLKAFEGLRDGLVPVGVGSSFFVSQPWESSKPSLCARDCSLKSRRTFWGPDGADFFFILVKLILGSITNNKIRPDLKIGSLTESIDQ